MAATAARYSCSLSLRGPSVSSAPRTRIFRMASTAANVQHLAFAQLYIGALLSARKALSIEGKRANFIRCSSSSASDGSASSFTSIAAAGDSWVPVIPLSALPRGERRLIRQDGEAVLLLWYKDDVYALENQSPAEGAYSEGMFNARLTPEGCIVCPSTESTFDLKTGEIKEWYPTNPILAFLTRPTRILEVYPVKTDGESVFINTRKGKTGESAEIVFGGRTQAGKTATDVSVDEVRMVEVAEDSGFGFTPFAEVVNGRAAMVGMYVVVLTELVSGKGFLRGLGLLDFLYRFIK